MSISIDGRGITLYQGTGIGTYTTNLVKELLKIDSTNNYTLFWCGKKDSTFCKSNSELIYCSKKHSAFYENHYIPSYINSKCQLHHIPQNGLGFYEEYTCPTIVTIHDLIPYTMPETVGKGYLERFLEHMPNIIKNSAAILTVSQYSKNDILKFFPSTPSDKIHVTPLATNDYYKPLSKDYCHQYLKKHYNLTTPFILYIGGFSQRKNVSGLINSFISLIPEIDKNIKLILCGSIKEEGETLQSQVNNLNLSDRIIFTGYIPEEILPVFYNSCEVFVYPSLYEGFGLPPLEAMSCMAPVITSNITSIPEVTSDSALLINPKNSSELTNAIYSILTNKNLRSDLASRGYKNSLQFNWRHTANLTLNVYNNLLQTIGTI